MTELGIGEKQEVGRWANNRVENSHLPPTTRMFNRIFASLAAKGGKPDQLMIDATHLKARRTAASL